MSTATTIPPSPFTPSQLAHWKTRLLSERRVVARDARATASELRDLDGSQPHDAADQAQLAEHALSSGEAAFEVARQIDDALRRIDGGDPVPFGLCERCMVPIEWERLELMPWTPWCARGAHGSAPGMPASAPTHSKHPDWSDHDHCARQL